MKNIIFYYNKKNDKLKTISTDRFLELKSKIENNNVDDLIHNNELLKKQIIDLSEKLQNIHKDKINKENIANCFKDNNFNKLELRNHNLTYDNELINIQIKLLENENKELKFQIEKISKNFNSEKDSLLYLIKNHNDEIINLKSYFLNLSNEKNLINENYQNIIQTMNDYFKKLKIYEKNFTLNNDIISKNDEELNHLKKKNYQIKNQNEIRNQEYENLNIKFSTLQEKYFRLQTENENYMKLYNESLINNNDKNKSFKDFEKEILKIKNEKEILENDVKTLERNNAFLNKKIEELNRIINNNKREIFDNNIKTHEQEKINSTFRVNHKKLKDMFNEVNYSKENLEKIKNYYSEILKERESKIFEILNEKNQLKEEIYELKSSNELTINENKKNLEKIKDLELKYNKLHQILINKHKN